MKTRGRVLEGVLQKNQRQAKKFWKYDGYGVKVADLHEVTGVLLDTMYDGRLYVPLSTLRQHGIQHWFGDEEQLILPVQYWKKVK